MCDLVHKYFLFQIKQRGFDITILYCFSLLMIILQRVRKLKHQVGYVKYHFQHTDRHINSAHCCNFIIVVAIESWFECHFWMYTL